MRETNLFIPFLIAGFLMTNCIQDIISHKGECRTMNNFEIKCKKCGSSDIKIVEYDDYDCNEEYCGSHYALKCQKCNEEEYLKE